MAIRGRNNASNSGKVRLGMIGGGEGAFIGAVHRLAARMDDHYELVAGALSSTPEKARRSGAALGLAADRIYDDFETMAKAEAKRGDGVEAVAIVTPNHMHAGPGLRLSEGRHSRHLRQAADDFARRGEETQGGRRQVRPDFRGHA